MPSISTSGSSQCIPQLDTRTISASGAACAKAFATRSAPQARASASSEIRIRVVERLDQRAERRLVEPGMDLVGDLIHEAIANRKDAAKLEEIRRRVRELNERFPLP